MTSAGPAEPTNPADDDIFEWSWPDSPGASHILARQRELEVLLKDRVPILLDTNFWVMAREAAFGERDDPELISLLGALRMAVGSGKAFFPLTSDLIAEFSKQTPERLEATMMLVDQLSLGVVMVPHHERMAAEVEAFFATAYPGHPPERRPLWTVNRRPKRTPYRRAKETPFVERRDGYDGRTIRAGCGVGRAQPDRSATSAKRSLSDTPCVSCGV